ncbi:MAG: serine/threonine protein kinase [Maribacter sp.]|nr:serine/threonine protein kinase [Maribacter sp.]
MITENIVGKRYELISKIGKGGMGTVYKAIDKNFNNMTIALKVLNDEFIGKHGKESPKLISQDTAFNRQDATICIDNEVSTVKQPVKKIATAMLVNEAAIAARINHPNVVRVYNTDESSGRPYIAMELIDGESFAEKLRKKGKLSLDEVIEYSIQICRGLRCAHVNNVVHRDLKPSNLMLAKDNIVKITDLGISRFITDGYLESQSNCTGTLTYMSPQQLLNQEVDARCDIYSFGIILYEFLTGRPPFHSGDIIHQHLNIVPKPLSQFVKEIPKEIENIVMKCLQKNPDDRFQNCDELIQSFVSYIKQSGQKDTSKTSSSSKHNSAKQSQKKFYSGIGVCMFILLVVIASVLSKKYWNKSLEPSINNTQTIASMENLRYNNWVGFDKTQESSAFLYEKAKVHFDFLEIVKSQMFINYINSLSTKRHKVAKNIINSGEPDEVSNLLTEYKEQLNAQILYISMITEMIESYGNLNLKDSVDRRIHEWLEALHQDVHIIDWNIQKTDSGEFLVDYTISGDAYEQKFFFKVNPKMNTINTVWNLGKEEFPQDTAIKMVQESFILDSQNKTKTKYLITKKSNFPKEKYDIIGWTVKKIDGQNFNVSYTYQKDFEEFGWFFKVNIDTSLIKRELALRRPL